MAIDDLSDIQYGAIFDLEVAEVAVHRRLVEVLAQSYVSHVDGCAIEVVLVVELDIVAQVRIVLRLSRVVERYEHGVCLLGHIP